MVTGAIKNKVDKIWDDIAAGGITNPITVIEQLTYLMFIRSLDEKELENEEFANMMGEAVDNIFPLSEVGQRQLFLLRIRDMQSLSLNASINCILSTKGRLHNVLFVMILMHRR